MEMQEKMDKKGQYRSREGHTEMRILCGGT